MTTQPHFVPDDPVLLSLQDESSLECVWWTVWVISWKRHRVSMRTGHAWSAPLEPMTHSVCRSCGDRHRKVIVEHSTIGLSSDRWFVTIFPEGYIQAEERVIAG